MFLILAPSGHIVDTSANGQWAKARRAYLNQQAGGDEYRVVLRFF